MRIFSIIIDNKKPTSNSRIIFLNNKKDKRLEESSNSSNSNLDISTLVGLINSEIDSVPKI